MKSICLLLLLPLLYFYAHSQQPRLVLPLGHNEGIVDCAISKNGKYLVTCSRDYSIKLWDLSSGFLLQTIRTGRRQVWLVAISNDNKKIASIQSDSTCKIYDFSSGGIITNFQRYERDISTGYPVKFTKLSFSSDDRTVFMATDDKTYVYDVQSGKYEYSMPSGYDINFEKGLAITSKLKEYSPHQTTISRSEYITPDKKKWRIIDFGIGPTFCKLSNSGEKAIVNYYGTHIIFFSSKSGRVELKQEDEGKKIYQSNAFFSENENKVVTVFESGIMQIWDANVGKLLCKIRGNLPTPGKYVYYPLYIPAVFHDNEQKLITVSDEHEIQEYNSVTGKLLRIIGKHKELITKLVLFDNNNKLMSVDNRGGIIIWDLSTTGLQLNFSQTIGNIEYASFINNKNDIKANGKATQMNIIDFWNCNVITLKNPEDIKNYIEKDAKRTEIVNSIEFPPGMLKDLYKTILDTLRKSGEGNGNEMFYELLSKRYYINSAGNRNKIYDFHTGALISEMKDCADEFYGVMNPDKTLVFGSCDEQEFGMWEMKTGKLLFKTDSVIYVDQTLFINGGKEIIFRKPKNVFVICDALTGRIKKRLNIPIEKSRVNYGDNEENFHFEIDTLGTKMLVYRSKRCDIWSLEQWQLAGQIQKESYGARFSNDGTKIIFKNAKNVSLFDAKTYKLLRSLDFESEQDNIEISFDCNYCLTITNSVIYIWDIRTGKQVLQYTILKDEDCFAQTPEGYYYSTPSAAKLLHYITQDMKLITFEQMDVKYNRPDKVLEAIGSNDKELIRSFRRAYERRLAKLQIDSTSFNKNYAAPQADFVNRNETQKNGLLQLRIKASDSTYNLDRFNVWVNETPLYGQRGINLRTRLSPTFDTTIKVQLSDGKNKIETSVFNVNGIESFRMPLINTYTPAIPSKTTNYFVGIGINEFADPGNNLKYSVKDIKDLSAKLYAKYKGNIQIDTLFNINVTVEKIKTLKQKLLNSGINDRVIIAYSGHGLLSDSLDYYLSTFTVDFKKPENNGLPYDELEALLDRIPARKKLLLIDACHSGEFDKADVSISTDDTVSSNGKTDKGRTKKRRFGLERSYELMQMLFVNVAKGTGAIIISASSGIDLAAEDDKLKNGVFTSSILDALKKDNVKISEFKTAVYEEVLRISHGKQKPTTRNEPVDVDWIVW